MSLKKHVIVPRSFVAGDLPEEPSTRNERFDRFPRLTNGEVRKLLAQGRIASLGTSGRVWQWTDDLPARSSRPTGAGRVSLECAIHDFIAAEMRHDVAPPEPEREFVPAIPPALGELVPA